MCPNLCWFDLALNEDNAARVGTVVTGRVTRVLATVGDFVNKGQPLVHLHSHELADARGAAAKAKVMVTVNEKELAFAKVELGHIHRLLEAKALLGYNRRALHSSSETTRNEKRSMSLKEITG
ncbi:MAG: efflux RND transporter periplasmic adaptor subunit [Blastocatellia bacterium]